MLFAKAALTLATLAAPCFASDRSITEYYADLGEYGTFDLTISADEGAMTWKSNLANIHTLATELGIVGGIPQMNYHLHSFWALPDDVDYAIGATACGANVTGGHYDPFYGCGPASGIPNATCIAIGKPRDPAFYKCSPAQYASGEYDDCEVGDLSGKHGALIVDSNGNAIGESTFSDPLAALNAQYVDERAFANFDKWGSIVFHNGSPRVLCAKIFKKEEEQCKVEFFLYNADTDKEIGLLKDTEIVQSNKYNIEARPSAGCPSTSSADLYLNLLEGIDINYERTENATPFLLYGDKRGNIKGRAYEPGSYLVTAVLSDDGVFVVAGEFEFDIVPKIGS